jgi:undecaprenyl-diphosphatase
MPISKVIILAIVQGLAELLPVSSSAHVVVAEKLMGLDPSSPEMTLLLVMLHTGTMFAVIVYFWAQWRAAFFNSMQAFQRFAFLLIFATALTGIIGEALIKMIERFGFRGQPAAEVEQLFSHLELIAPALALAGVLILIAGIYERRSPNPELQLGSAGGEELDAKRAGLIGAVQGLCLPFRGFSRSGATISAGMLAGVPKALAEQFSFALAVVLTPAADGRELLRLMKAQHASGGAGLAHAILPGIGVSLLGALFAFFAGLLALRWLSRWLEHGRWYLFGIYCLVAAAGVAYLHHIGY